MKKYILIILLLFISIKSVNAINELDNNKKIYDYAVVLNNKQEEKLNRKIEKFINKTNTNLIIITVRHPSIKDTKEYLNEFYKKNINNESILLVLNLDNNTMKLDMEVYGNKKIMYSDEQINQILNHVNKEKNYYKTLINFIDEVETNNNYINNYNKYLNIKYWLLIIIPSIILSSIITFIKVLNNKKENKYEDNKYLKLDSLIIDKRLDNFLTTHTSKSRIK